MFDRWFGPKNPTRDWVRRENLQLDFDLQACSLNGVTLGNPSDAVSFLGTAEERLHLQYDEYTYYSLGLCVCCEEEKAIEGFSIFNRDPSALKPMQPFAGRFHFGGTDLLMSQLIEPMFRSKFGEPYWRDVDDTEILLFYEFPGLEWQVEFNLDGSFKSILVTSNVLLSGEEQRRAYGITRPWPPDS